MSCFVWDVYWCCRNVHKTLEWLGQKNKVLSSTQPRCLLWCIPQCRAPRSLLMIALWEGFTGSFDAAFPITCPSVTCLLHAATLCLSFWIMAGVKAQKTQAAAEANTDSSWSRTATHNFPETTPASWLRCAVCWCCSTDAVRDWPLSGVLSCYQLWNLKGLFPPQSSDSLSLTWADLCCGGGRVCSNL